MEERGGNLRKFNVNEKASKDLIIAVEAHHWA